MQESPGAASATLYRILVYLLWFKTGGLSRNLEYLHSVDVYSRCDHLKKSRTPRPSKSESLDFIQSFAAGIFPVLCPDELKWV